MLQQELQPLKHYKHLGQPRKIHHARYHGFIGSAASDSHDQNGTQNLLSSQLYRGTDNTLGLLKDKRTLSQANVVQLIENTSSQQHIRKTMESMSVEQANQSGPLDLSRINSKVMK